MAIEFDPIEKRVILDRTHVHASYLWSRWIDWLRLGDNIKYAPVFSQSGGDELEPGIYSPTIIYLENEWRVRPMEANQSLIIDGLLKVRGGGVPVVPTLGAYQVVTSYQSPMMAMAVSTNGTLGPTAAEIAEAVFARSIEGDMSFQKMMRIHHAVMTGLIEGAGTAVERFKSLDGTTDRLIVHADEFGNRTMVVMNGD
jgi:hypothetical protein